MQTAIVLLIVAAAAFFLARRLYHSIGKENSSTCGCGCSGCHSIQSCTEGQMPQNQSRKITTEDTARPKAATRLNS